MAITNTQQARQMYNKGSKKPVTHAGVKNFLGKQEMVTAPKFWLSEPDHVKAKLAYITDEEEKILIDKNLYGSLKGKPNKGPAGLPSLQGGDFGSEGAGTGDSQGGGDKGGTGKGRDLDFQQRGMTKGDYATGRGAGRGGDRSQNFGGRSKFSALDFIPGVGTVRRFARMFGPVNNLDFFNQKVTPAGKFKGKGFDDYMSQRQAGLIDAYGNPIDQDNDGNYIPPTFAQTQITGGLPAAVQPMQTMDLDRIAYRFMADGGFLDDEVDERQAYGLGSIVRKITRPIKKVVKKATRAVKKVAKSPTGRLLLAVAAPYALGPAMANSAFLSGLSAAQKAALISGATTGITQIASGEDLDLKNIALSAAIGGATASAFPPGGKPAPGVDGKSFAASRASSPNLFDADDVVLASQRAASDPSRFTAFTKEVLNPQGIAQTKPSLFSSITKNLGKFGGKTLEFAKENPFLTIAGASGLAGLMAKQEEQEEPGEIDRGPGIDIAAIRRRPFDYLAPRFAGSEFDFYAAEGGQAKKEPVAKKVMPLLDMGGMEKDYREDGGFVPIGRMEKADDVPARLSKNEFVFTADAVRNAGDGDVDKGAEVMYNMMKNLEAGGDVSEESQGLEGARRMFQTSQRLEEVL